MRADSLLSASVPARDSVDCDHQENDAGARKLERPETRCPACGELANSDNDADCTEDANDGPCQYPTRPHRRQPEPWIRWTSIFNASCLVIRLSVGPRVRLRGGY